VTMPIVTTSSLLLAASQERCLWHLPRIGCGLSPYRREGYGPLPRATCLLDKLCCSRGICKKPEPRPAISSAGSHWCGVGGVVL